MARRDRAEEQQKRAEKGSVCRRRERNTATMQQAIMQQALEANLMNIATTIEDQLDDEMHR